MVSQDLDSTRLNADSVTTLTLFFVKVQFTEFCVRIPILSFTMVVFSTTALDTFSRDTPTPFDSLSEKITSNYPKMQISIFNSDASDFTTYYDIFDDVWIVDGSRSSPTFTVCQIIEFGVRMNSNRDMISDNIRYSMGIPSTN
jgi:hypothetical protein